MIPLRLPVKFPDFDDQQLEAGQVIQRTGPPRR
jgi:hypothetical protein